MRREDGECGRIFSVLREKKHVFVLEEGKMMFNGSMTMEQEQERCLINDSLSREFTAAWQRSCCAWSLREQGLEPGNNSHGICLRHCAWCLREQGLEPGNGSHG